MIEIKGQPGGVEVVATGFREKFNSRFKAIMAANSLAYTESSLHGGRRIDIVVPVGWGEGYVVRDRAGRPVASDANNYA